MAPVFSNISCYGDDVSYLDKQDYNNNLHTKKLTKNSLTACESS